MDSIDYAKKLRDEFQVDLSDALKALDAETDDHRKDPFHGRKPSYKEALDAAYMAIRDWLRTGEEYVINLNWDDLNQFTFSHRKACVWAVFTAKSRAAKAVAK